MKTISKTVCYVLLTFLPLGALGSSVLDADAVQLDAPVENLSIIVSQFKTDIKNTTDPAEQVAKTNVFLANMLSVLAVVDLRAVQLKFIEENRPGTSTTEVIDLYKSSSEFSDFDMALLNLKDWTDQVGGFTKQTMGKTKHSVVNRHRISFI